jgi:hypothetical protein
VTQDVTGHGDGPLVALGRVEPPRPAVLEAAREALWSAVAAEMLATQPPGGSRRGRAAGPEHKQRRQDGPGS